MSKTKELFEAIYSNNIENVKRALSEGAEINGPSEEYGGFTPLMAAVGAWHMDILNFLLDKGADVKAKTPAGDTILSIMIGQGFSFGPRINEQYHNLIRKIISKGVDVDSYNQNGDNNPLLISMSSADVETVDMLIEAGANLNIIVHKDNPDVPLNRAISQLVRMRPDAEYIIDKMIAKGANVNPKAENLRSSPLSSAVVEGREDIFNKLVKQYGADINHACSTTTPLISAILAKNTLMTDKLVDMGAHINPENTKLAYSPLSAAISVGDDKLALGLMKMGANVAPKNVQITPIAQAIAGDMVDILELMLSVDSVSQQQMVDGLLWNMHKCDSPSFNLALVKVKDINLPSQLGQTLLGRAIFTREEKFSVFAQKLILQHKAKLQFNEFSSLIQLAHRPNSEGMNLIDLILKTTDDQALKLEGMNVALENMLKCVNGVNIEVLKIFIEHGLIISPSNIKLALAHQNLPHPVYPNYINEMLQLVHQNQEKAAADGLHTGTLSLSSTSNENLSDDHHKVVVTSSSQVPQNREKAAADDLSTVHLSLANLSLSSTSNSNENLSDDHHKVVVTSSSQVPQNREKAEEDDLSTLNLSLATLSLSSTSNQDFSDDESVTEGHYVKIIGDGNSTQTF